MFILQRPLIPSGIESGHGATICGGRAEGGEEEVPDADNN